MWSLRNGLRYRPSHELPKIAVPQGLLFEASAAQENGRENCFQEGTGSCDVLLLLWLSYRLTSSKQARKPARFCLRLHVRLATARFKGRSAAEEAVKAG